MAWDHLSIDKPHLVYLILGGFTTLFMLCSSVIKERLYIGEATVATICGVIFGPHAANLIDPGTWGNTDQITIEFSRIVLVVQCFAVGVELPRAYMERHWRSVVFLLIPVMTFGWLITSLFIWGLFHTRLDWLDSLIIAACVTATDPVLASSVVGKGKFAKRVPKHLRDLLSAESGCNDGMAFPFVYLAIYISQYKGSPNEVALNWFCTTILYECIFGAVYGVTIGFIARKAVRYAHERDLNDRESFLVFYFVLALFCAGSGSLLGMDDLLIGFACGVGFSNDGWFLEKTEESHVSNVIDLLINLAFFVYLGTIIPWAQYNDAVLGINPWKLVVLALLVLFFRRIPIMMLLKPMIPDIKTWREALFAGHFGPIGVGAIFVAILARAEMEGSETTPLATLPPFDAEHANVVYLVWPIVTFLVLASILVHGSSIAVFTLGKRINTLTITMSYTQAGEDGNWMDRLPRIQSRSKTSGSRARSDASGSDIDEEKMPDYPAATLPKNFLRRQKEGETPTHSRGNSRDRKRRSRRWSGGPVEESAIRPRPRQQDSDSSTLQQDQSPSDTLAIHSESSGAARDGDEPDKHAGSKRKGKKHDDDEREIETFQEGGDTVFEDEEGNVLEVMTSKEGETDEEHQRSVEEEAKNLMSDEDVEHGVSQKEQGIQSGLHMDEVEHNITDHDMKGQEGNELENHGHAPESSGENGKTGMLEHEAQRLKGMGKRMMSGLHMKRDPDMHPEKEGQPPKAEKTQPHRSNRGPARAYRFGRTIIVEDEDGEVIKKYDIPAPEKPQKTTQNHANPGHTRQRLTRMGTMLGINKEEAVDAAENGTKNVDVEKPRVDKQKKKKPEDDNDDDVRFTVGGNARRMNRADFIRQISEFDPKTRAKVVENSDAPRKVKEAAREDEREHSDNKRKASVQSMHGQDVQSRKDDGDKVVSRRSTGTITVQVLKGWLLLTRRMNIFLCTISHQAMTSLAKAVEAVLLRPEEAVVRRRLNVAAVKQLVPLQQVVGTSPHMHLKAQMLARPVTETPPARHLRRSPLTTVLNPPTTLTTMAPNASRPPVLNYSTSRTTATPLLIALISTPNPPTLPKPPQSAAAANKPLAQARKIAIATMMTLRHRHLVPATHAGLYVELLVDVTMTLLKRTRMKKRMRVAKYQLTSRQGEGRRASGSWIRRRGRGWRGRDMIGIGKARGRRMRRRRRRRRVRVLLIMMVMLVPALVRG